MSDPVKPLLIDITGQTLFHLGNKKAPLDVDIAIGYRKREKSSYLHATLKSHKNGGLTIDDLFMACTENYKEIPVPDIIKNVAFESFSVAYGSGDFQSSDLTIQFECNILINEKTFYATILIDYKKDLKNTTTFTFKGILKVGEHQFDLQFKKVEHGCWYIYARIKQRAIKIDLHDMLSRFLQIADPTKIPSLSFKLDNFNVFFLYKSGKDSSMLFGMGAGLDLDLKKLPLAGPILTKNKAFEFKEVLALYANGKFSEIELNSFDGLPKVDVSRGFNISINLLIDGKSEFYAFDGTEPKNDVNPAPVDEVTNPKAKESIAKSAPPDKTTNTPAPLDGTTSSKVKWKKLDKKIGPVNIQRIGFLYQDGKVAVLLDASMAMASMGMQLMGFGLGFKLQWKWPPDKPDFYLDGLGLSYKAPPIEISGAFLHSNSNGIDTYSGGAIVKISRFTITAIGSYAEVGNETNVEKEPSLFIYGVFYGSIGGPAFFFVTGIAAGFGYNRKVNIPSVDEVMQFPMVSMAMAPPNDEHKDEGLPGVLKKLETPMKNNKTPIEISIGNYWLAIGIRFTSFNIVESFVLVTVNFGVQLEFAVLGLSRLTWPNKNNEPKSDVSPIAYVELAILAHFGPASDVISVEAAITPNSYIFSKDCKLTGGFAFYVWIKGEYEGDFVITLGGYHPKFGKPPHYPTVPRLGLSWKVTNELSIKGEMYYALTSSCIMAGGRWEVLYNTREVKVTFIIWADMIISWAPIYYNIGIGVYLSIELNIKIVFVRIHLFVSLSANLEIWGPPFAGKVQVHLAIFSFTIPFGDHSKKPSEKLTWNEFSKGFVPQKKDGTGPDPINITIINGLIDVKGEEKFPVINAQQLAIAVDSFIPIKELTYVGKKVGETAEKIGIRPCGFISTDVNFLMNVSVKLGDKDVIMSVTCIVKGMAEALWSGEVSQYNNTNPGTSKLIPNVLTGLIIKPPASGNNSKRKSVVFSSLFDESFQSFEWECTQVKDASAYHAYDVLGSFSKEQKKKTQGVLELSYPTLREKRKNIYDALLNVGFDTLTEIDETGMDEIIAGGNDYFKGIPVLCGIGEIPQYPTDVEIADPDNIQNKYE